MGMGGAKGEGHSLIKVQSIEDVLSGLQYLVHIVMTIWVAFEGQVNKGHLQGYNVLRGHVWTVL